MASGSVHGRLESFSRKILSFATGSASLVFATAILNAAVPESSFGQATSTWVHYDKHGRLQYATDPQGNRIMDYSTAGYEGGGVALPHVPARATVKPSGGDDTAAIQAAIDTVSALSPDPCGFRGAVLLASGNFNVSATLNITSSGVVLAGSGSDANGTIITMTGSPFTLINNTVDPDRNGTFAEPLPAGTYTGSGTNAYTVDNKEQRNGAYGPGFFNLDMRVSYAFRFGTRQVEIVGDMFNLTNHTNFANPTNNQASAQFLLLSAYSTSYAPRKLQLGARFVF